VSSLKSLCSVSITHGERDYVQGRDTYDYTSDDEQRVTPECALLRDLFQKYLPYILFYSRRISVPREFFFT
jgi:hypothetical protein